MEKLCTNSQKLTITQIEARDGLITDSKKKGGYEKSTKNGSHVSHGFSQAFFFFLVVSSFLSFSFISLSPFLPFSLLSLLIRV
jgi:uncharacterized membrane protein